MAQISIEKLYRGQGSGKKHGILGQVMKDFLTNGYSAEYDKRTWIEMLIVRHTLIIAEKMKNRATLYRELPIWSRSLPMRRGKKMRILEEFWYGNINPNEQSFDKQSRFGKVMSLLTKNESKLLERLNAEKKIFEKYQDCQHEITQIGEYEAFIKGFRLGGQMMLEVCDDIDCPLINEM